MHKSWGSDSNSYEKYCNKGCDVMYFYRNLLVFWRKLPPSLWEMNEELKTKVEGSSKTVINFFRATQLHVPERTRCVVETEQVY
jgi:hypothetical protein